MSKKHFAFSNGKIPTILHFLFQIGLDTHFAHLCMLNSSNISANQKQASHRIDSRGNLTIQINYHSFTAMLGKQAYCFVGIERDKTTHNHVLIDSTDHTITVTRIISYRYPPSWSRPRPSESIMQNHVAIAAQESVI